jgi:hypothetical protein
MYEVMSLRQHSWSVAAAGAAERKKAAQEIAATPNLEGLFNFAFLFICDRMLSHGA